MASTRGLAPASPVKAPRPQLPAGAPFGLGSDLGFSRQLPARRQALQRGPSARGAAAARQLWLALRAAASEALGLPKTIINTIDHWRSSAKSQNSCNSQ